MHTFTTPGVIIKFADHMYYKKAYVLSKYGCWSGYIPSYMSVHIDTLTYTTCIWEGKTADSTGTWVDFLDPIHLSSHTQLSSAFHTSVASESVSEVISEQRIIANNHSEISSSHILHHSDHSTHQQSVNHSYISKHTSSSHSQIYLTSTYIAHLCMCLPEHYADQNIWMSMLKALSYLYENEWLHAWFTFEMSILDTQYNRFDYTSRQYIELSSVNNNKIAQYANKYTMRLRAKLHKALSDSK